MIGLLSGTEVHSSSDFLKDLQSFRVIFTHDISIVEFSFFSLARKAAAVFDFKTSRLYLELNTLSLHLLLSLHRVKNKDLGHHFSHNNCHYCGGGGGSVDGGSVFGPVSIPDGGGLASIANLREVKKCCLYILHRLRIEESLLYFYPRVLCMCCTICQIVSAERRVFFCKKAMSLRLRERWRMGGSWCPLSDLCAARICAVLQDDVLGHCKA